MGDKAAKLLARWQNHVPPDVPKDDVENVLEAYFPGSYQMLSGGSHTWLVTHECLARAAEFGVATNYAGGNLSIPLKGGRRVLQVYVKRLMRAIELKAEFERAQQEEEL